MRGSLFMTKQAAWGCREIFEALQAMPINKSASSAGRVSSSTPPSSATSPQNSRELPPLPRPAPSPGPNPFADASQAAKS